MGKVEEVEKHEQALKSKERATQALNAILSGWEIVALPAGI